MKTNLPVFPSERPSLDEWFSRPAIQLQHSYTAKTPTSPRIFTAQLNPTPDFYPAPATQSEFVVVALNGANSIEVQMEDGGRLNTQILPGAVQVIPHSIALASRWNGVTHAVFIEVPNKAIEGWVEVVSKSAPARIEIPYSFNVCDTLVYNLCIEIVDHLGSNHFIDDLYIGGAIDFLALHLLKHYSNLTTVHPAKGSKLTTHQQRQIEQYLQEHLGERILVDDLAATVHLSRPHFQRLFRATYHR